jgi:hypothetical protein
MLLLPLGAASPGIIACNFVLNFDPKIIEVRGTVVENVDLVINDSSYATDGTPKTTGTFEVSVGSFFEVSPSTGWGILARITLKGISPGESPLSLTEVRINGPTMRNEDIVPVEPVEGATRGQR